MVRKERFHCNRCARAFLSKDALMQHYDQRPGHPNPVTINARNLKEEGTALEDTDWVEFDNRVETYLEVVDAVDEESLEMTYRPEEGTTTISNEVVDQTINVDRIQDLTSDHFRWSFDGTYHRLAFLK